MIHIDVQDLVSGSFAKNSKFSLVSIQSLTIFKLFSDISINFEIPPTSFDQLREFKTSSTLIIEGVLIVAPEKIPDINF